MACGKSFVTIPGGVDACKASIGGASGDADLYRRIIAPKVAVMITTVMWTHYHGLDFTFFDFNKNRA